MSNDQPITLTLSKKTKYYKEPLTLTLTKITFAQKYSNLSSKRGFNNYSSVNTIPANRTTNNIPSKNKKCKLIISCARKKV